jgi:hypothetical protein
VPTDTCECGRPEVGKAHCPVHGDGKRPAAVVDAQPRRGRPAGTRRGRPAKPPTK